MFIDTMKRFAELHRCVAILFRPDHRHRPSALPGRTADRRTSAPLARSPLEHPHRRHAPGVHDHLMFGEGEIDFAPVLQTLHEIGYTGGVHVELSRHSHDAVETARRALAFLRAAK